MKTRAKRSCFLLFLCFVALWKATLLSATDACAGNTGRPFRVAFSSSMFADANENDVRAAMKVWIMAWAKERNLPADPNAYICRTIEELLKVGRDQEADGFGITTPEYARLSQEIKFDRFAASVKGSFITEEYLLLVRRDSGLERLDQLKGRSLNVLNSPRMSLAVIWLDTVLVKAHLRRTVNFFNRVTSNNKASQVALPVFFGKTDACLINLSTFKVMAELNPQMNKQLRVLAASPPFVPSGFAFRAEHTYPYRAQILDVMTKMHHSEAGRQILALTQSGTIEDHPVACLNSSLELLAEHRRLCGPARTVQERIAGAASGKVKSGKR